MARMIFVNLPVSDLARAVRFYESVGFTKNPEFSDDTAAGMALTEVIHVMLLTHEKFASFTTRPIATREVIEVSNCLSCETRAEVDALVEKAIAGGGRADPMPAQDYGFMYFRQFEDPDGHVWEVMFMDLAAFRAAKAGESVPA
jgi:predicted lactoylglutathione lyase